MAKCELREIRIEDIEVGERARSDVGDIEGLAASIGRRGTISPIAVWDKGEGTSPRYLLLAGERRLEAHKLLLLKTIHANVYLDQNISELDRLEIELEENYYRKNFSVFEQAALCKKIHDLKQQIHGKRINLPGIDEGWGLKDTAELLGSSTTSVHRNIKIAEAMESFPQLFEKCKNKKDAEKVLHRVEEAALMKELAKKVESEWKGKPGGNDIRTSLLKSYILGNFYDEIKKVESGSINFVEMDPPYAINLDSMKEGADGGGTISYNEMPESVYLFKMEEALQECHRVMSEHSWLVMWCAVQWYPQLLELLRRVGFHCNSIPGVWPKSSGQNKQPDCNLTSSYEIFLYARKGSPVIVKAGRSNVFSYPPVAATKKIHPTQRPLPLILELLSTFTWKGSRVLVPFAGSGTTIYAAYLLGCTAFGYDLSEEYRNKYLVWMADAPLRLEEASND